MSEKVGKKSCSVNCVYAIINLTFCLIWKKLTYILKMLTRNKSSDIKWGSDIVDKQLTRISELKQQLIATGYHSTQFNDIVREVIGNASLANITNEQCSELIESLEYYCDFAAKCKKGNCKK